MRAITALGVSILIHGLIAVGLVAYLEYAPQPDVLATLDLTSVELSFAEEEQETAAVAPALPSAAERRPPKPKVDTKPPEPKLEKPLPPDAESVKFPEPKEERRMGPAKDERRKTEETRAESSPLIAPRQAKLDAPPKPKRNIKPDYPKGARQRGEQGDVVLEIRVNAEGTVDGVKVAVSSGFAELDEAAIKAAKAAKFSPARSGHDPVASTARLRLQFKLK